MIVGNGYSTGTADPGFYGNALKQLISDPGSFSGTPGYGFAFDQAMKGVNAQNSTIRGSGNALAALQDRASGLASQNFGDYLKTLGGLTGQEQQYDLSLAGAGNAAQGNANQLTLGEGNLANTAQRNANDFALGNTNAANNFTLGQQQNANGAQRNWYDYQLGNQQNTNQFNLGLYNAQTNRENAGANTLLDWTKFGYQLNPAQRIAGVPGTFGGGWPGVG